MKTIKDISYTLLGHPEQKLDVYLPKTDTFPVFVYFHGGGIINGDKAWHTCEAFIPGLVERGIAVVSSSTNLHRFTTSQPAETMPRCASSFPNLIWKTVLSRHSFCARP